MKTLKFYELSTFNGGFGGEKHFNDKFVGFSFGRTKEEALKVFNKLNHTKYTIDPWGLEIREYSMNNAFRLIKEKNSELNQIIDESTKLITSNIDVYNKIKNKLEK